jgi:hypothetical protein
MSTDFLSAPMEFGSVDYTDPRVVSALQLQGLKERTTYGGQIVTALKMAWWVLTLPVMFPFGVCQKCVLWLYWVATRLCRRVGRCYRLIHIWVSDWIMIGRTFLNKRMRCAVVLTYLLALGYFGLTGCLLLTFIYTCVIGCVLPTDVKYYIRLMEQLGRAWDSALDAKDLPDTMENVTIKANKRDKFACKIAIRAISKVGLLSPTKANALVYQKVILDEMRALNVRCADRVRVLPLAIAACLERPEEVRRVEGCIRYLTAQSLSH